MEDIDWKEIDEIANAVHYQYNLWYWYGYSSEDFIQDVKLRVWRSFLEGSYYTGDNGAKFSTWVFSVCHNYARNKITSHKRKGFNHHGKRFYSGDIECVLESDSEDGDIKPHFFPILLQEQYIDSILSDPLDTLVMEKQMVVRCLRRLYRSKNGKTLFKMSSMLLRGKKYEEIAEHLSVPIGTVRSSLNRAKMKLNQHHNELVGVEL